MSLMAHVGTMFPISVPHPPAMRNTVRADASAAGLRPAIKRFCKFALAIVLFTVVVAGIVALKSAVWIPHFTH